MKKYIKGFTLAEVLITLSILGVVAAIMIPSTVRRITDRQTVNAVKRAYSMIDNAIQQAIIINGPMQAWDWPDKSSIEQQEKSSPNNNNFFMQILSEYIPVSKFCGSSRGCFNDDGRHASDGWGLHSTLKNNRGGYIDFATSGKAILKNGMLVSLNVFNRTDMGGIFGIILVDVNGKREPDRYGYDVFLFPFNKYGIMGNNTPRDTKISDFYQYFFMKDYCSKYNNVTDARDGQSCYFWIIKHNNMDYKYRDVSSEW